MKKFSIRNCPTCQSNRFRLVVELQVKSFCDANFAYKPDGYKKLGFSGDDKFPLVRCMDCGCVYSRCLLELSLMRRVYAELIDPDICREHSRFPECYEANRDISVRTLAALKENRADEEKDLKILDFGAGFGVYLEVSRKKGRQTYAYEFDCSKFEHLATVCDWVIDTLDGLKAHAPYDVIHCNQVLEHVPEPASILKLFYELLEVDGVLYISVPNCRDDYLYRQLELFNDHQPPKELNPWEHLNYFSPDGLKGLIKTIGLEFSEDIGDTTELICKRSLPNHPQIDATPENGALHVENWGQYKHNSVIKKESNFCPDLTVCIFATGEPLFKKCVEALERQILKPVTVEVVKDVAPLDRAFAEGLARVRTKYYVSVDADMVLFPYCLSFLYSKILTDDKAFEAIAHLEDPFLGYIEGVRIYNRELVEKMGGFPQSCGPERRLMNEAKRFGFNRLYYYDVVGEHHPQYTLEEAFWKFKTETERLLLHNGGNQKCWRLGLDDLVGKYLSRKDEISIAALAGYFYGAVTDGRELFKEIDFKEREENTYLKKFSRFLKRKRYYSATSMTRAPIYQQKKEMERLGRFIQLNGVRNALIYGAANTGFMLEMVLEQYFNVSVSAFIDGSPVKIGTQIGDKPVHAINGACHFNYDAVFLGVSDIHQDSVFNTLISHGFEPAKIFRLYEG